jgi:hypothetical protein
MNTARILLFACMVAAACAPAAYAKKPAAVANPLQLYAVATVADSAAANSLRSRFRANGNPLFLIHNIRMGITQGDIIRFDNRAVLIDAQVWQTLKQDGIFKKVSPVPLMFQRAGTKSEHWHQRAGLAASKEQQKVFMLGSQLLKVFEDGFGKIPKSRELVLQFNNNNVVLIAPKKLMRSLRVKPIEIVTKSVPEIPDSVATDTAPADTALYSKQPRPSVIALLIRPEWDTLTVGHRYVWKLNSLLAQLDTKQIRLSAIKGSRSIEFADSAIVLMPRKAGRYKLRFHFVIGSDSCDTVVCPYSFPVKPDLPPVFSSKLDNWQFHVGQDISYKPVASDPEKKSVAIRAARQHDWHYSWNGKALALGTDHPGTYSAELVATDNMGNSSRQRLIWEVLEEPKNWRAATFESKLTGGYNLLSLSYRNPRIRAGILTPCIEKIFSPKFEQLRHLPYVFFGGNVLSEARTREGEFLFLDIGITGRRPHEKLVTGGIYFAADTRFIHKRPFSFLSEFELSITANQVIVLADTTGIIPHFNDSTELEAFLDSMEQFEDEYIALGEALLGESVGRDNITALLRLEALVPLRRGFSAGPIFWSHITPYNVQMHQFVGLSLRYSKMWPHFNVEQTLRMGFGGTKQPFRMWWDMTAGLGRWR